MNWEHRKTTLPAPHSRQLIPPLGPIGLGCAILMACLSGVGCQTAEVCSRRHVVDAELATRVGMSLGPHAPPGVVSVPDSVQIEDGISADEAVTTALWNNAAFQEALAQLGISRAQLLDAGLFPDPQVQIFLPLGPKQFELTGYQALDALWLRPIRQRAAELDLVRVTDQLVQNGLNVIRDVRLAHANLLMAQQQLELADETLELRQEIARLAKKRADAGAISELEAAAPKIDALQAEADRSRALGEIEFSRAQLLILMGLPESGCELVAVGASLPNCRVACTDDLIAEALAVRPDLRAAEINVQAAAERLELAKCRWMTFDGILDMNSQGTQGFEAGPGMRFTIPFFNGNRGQVAIAEANLEAAQRQFVTIRDQIRNDVLSAHARWVQATRTLDDMRSKVLPATEEASELAQKNYESGGTSYLLTLQTLGQYLSARGQEIALAADVRRALAELDRSVGHRVKCEAAVEETNIPYLPAPNEIAPLPDEVEADKRTSNERLPACRPVSFEIKPTDDSGDRKP